MATATANYGTNTALTVTNLHSLGDGLYWQSAAIDNGTVKALWVEVFITILTTTTGGSATGTIELFMAGATDGGTDYAGGATGSEGTYTDTTNTDPKLLTRIDTMPCDASEVSARTYEFHTRFYDPPEDFVLLIRNRTGTAIGASTNAVEYRLNKHDVA